MDLFTKKFFRSHLPLVCFSVFVALSFVVLVVYQSRALKEMRERNEKILSHYSQVLAVSPEKRAIDNIDWQFFVNEMGLSPAQVFVFQDYTNKVVDKAVALSHVDLETNSIVEAKAVAMFQETKDLLEMQFAKIQHESESLQIWCGLLTVVFLIFSFYSLFKTDELVKQGREGVRELSSMQEKGKQRIDGLEIEGRQKIALFDGQAQESITQFRAKAVREEQQIRFSLDSLTKKAEDSMDSKSMELMTALDKKYADLADALEAKMEGDSKQTASAERELLDQTIKILDLRVVELERKMEEGNG